MTRKTKVLVWLFTPLYVLCYGFAKLFNYADEMPSMSEWRQIMKGGYYIG